MKRFMTRTGVFLMSILGVFSVWGSYPVSAATCTEDTSSSTSVWLKYKCGLPSSSVYDILENLMIWLLEILGFLSIIAFVIAGVFYLTAAGDEKTAGKAKLSMTFAIYGIITALSGYIVIQAIKYALNATSQF